MSDQNVVTYRHPEDVTAPGETRPLITISVPVLNEAGNVTRLLERLSAVAKNEHERYRFEFLFTDNASTDETFEILAKLASKDDRVRVLRFSRNFGFQPSILTNYLHARGAAAIQIDADMQDPPEMIPEFLRAWENGYRVVYGIRKHRKEFFLLEGVRKLYYRTLTWLAEVDVPRDAGDFRLIDRVILDQLRAVDEQTPYLRGLIATMGFSQMGIPYSRAARSEGSTKFRLFHLIRFALDGVTAQSTRPLTLITMFGFGVSALTVLLIIFYLSYYLFVDAQLPSGFVTIVLLVLGSIGLNALFLGFIGEYVGRIFNNNRGLPISIIEHRIEPVRTQRDSDAGAASDPGSEEQVQEIES